MWQSISNSLQNSISNIGLADTQNKDEIFLETTLNLLMEGNIHKSMNFQSSYRDAVLIPKAWVIRGDLKSFCKEASSL